MNQPEGIELSPELEKKCQAELEPDEKVVWARRPLAWLYCRKSIKFMFLGIVTGGFALFWIGATTEIFSKSGGLSGPFAMRELLCMLISLPTVYVACHCLSAPIWMIGIARRTAYVVTTRRVIIFQGRFIVGPTMESFLPRRLVSMDCQERADGNGDLIFEQFQKGVGSGAYTIRKGFMAVYQVREVERIVSKTLLASRLRKQTE